MNFQYNKDFSVLFVCKCCFDCWHITDIYNIEILKHSNTLKFAVAKYHTSTSIYRRLGICNEENEFANWITQVILKQ
jgi:hypothetical protein